MKTLMQFVAGVILFAAPLFLSAQQRCPEVKITADKGQQILVKQNGQLRAKGNVGGLMSNTTGVTAGSAIKLNNSSPFDFEFKDELKTVPNNDCRDTTCNECGWYKAFWIFGDGNYRKFANDVSYMDAASLKVNYRYGNNATYVPAVYLTERYHNDEKPEAARIAIEVTGGASGTLVDSPRRLDPASKTTDIDYNDEFRKKYPTVFVLSHLKSENITRSFFFYNSTRREGIYIPTKIASHDTTEIPSYYKVAGRFETNYDTLGGPFRNLYAGGVLDEFRKSFLSCTQYNYAGTVDPTLTASLNELRMFPVLNTINFGPGQIPQDSAVVATVVLGTSPLTGEALINMRNLIISLFTPDTSLNIPSNLQVFINVGEGQEVVPEYIRGVSFATLRVLASHDPNNLFVTKIDTISSDKYKVSFSQRICNQSEMTEISPVLEFHDLTGGHYAATPEFFDLDSGVTIIPRIGSGYILQNFTIGPVPAQYIPKCKFVHFRIETDLAGVQRLFQEDPRALEVCVKFSNAVAGTEPECSVNDVLKAEDLQRLQPPPVDNNNCWILFFLALLVLILIIYAWRNAQQNT